MRKISFAFALGILIFAAGHGFWSRVRAESGDDERTSGFGVRGPRLPWPGRFDVQVLVGGLPVPQEIVGGERRIEAVAAQEFDLRLTNPLPDRVAVAVSVDGLNVLDARHTTGWDASKWVIHPHGTLTISGWQVGSERARRFYFTTERDAYATRIGRTGDFGVISAVFYRERRPVSEIVPGRTALPERRDPLSASDAPAAELPARSALGRDGRSIGRLAPWRYDGRAATGIGTSVASEVQQVSMDLERHPVSVVTVHYDFRRFSPPPIIVPGFAPEPVEREWSPPPRSGPLRPVP
jgi:hypothetical protein